MVFNRQRQVRVAVRPLEEFLSRVKSLLDLSEDITVCLVSDAVITQMNAAYRKKHGPTDVLSFGSNGDKVRIVKRKSRVPARERAKFDNSQELGTGYLGDIAIAPATARRNARRMGRTLPAELQILILHGVLHLLGYDHEADRGQMNHLERRLRRRLALE